MHDRPTTVYTGHSSKNKQFSFPMHIIKILNPNCPKNIESEFILVTIIKKKIPYSG